ncbi:MAG: hypothetical protein M3P91_07380 [Actinomycetota bacterium]|nr:hypothetical protein [Actinomycetota bacterium]
MATAVSTGQKIEPVTREDVHAVVLKAGGARGAQIWADVCTAARLSSSAASLNRVELERLLDALIALGGLISIMARGLRVRSTSYYTLNLLNR